MEEYSDKDFPDPANRSENRKSNKPIMEKRRRARINYCLNELKSLILDAMKKDPARHSKLEKADILEMTVKHLQSVQRQQLAMAVSSDPSVLSKFKNGFSECASEVSRYVSRIDGVDQGVCQRMVSHLIRCMSGIQTSPNGLNPVSGSSSVLILPNYPGRSSLPSDFLHPPPLPDANFHTRLLTSLKAMQHFGDLSSFFPTLRESQGNVPPNIPTTPTTCTTFNVGNKSAEYSTFLPVKRPRSPSPLREKKTPHKSLKLTIPEERCDTFSTNNNVVDKPNHSEDIPRRNIPTPPSSPVAGRREPSSTDMWRPW